MKWFLEEKYPKAQREIKYGDGIVFMGSCFSQNIFEKGKRLGFNFINTEHGTIFHPIPIARILFDAIQLNTEYRIVENEGRFYSWDASTKLMEDSENKLLERLKREQTKLHENLKQAKYLFLTFGTAKAYLNRDDLLVANCHKIHTNEFSVERSSLENLIEVYQELIQQLLDFNPELQIVLTVSPVRHSKDGLIENNRSKARLLMLCEELDNYDSVHYFPAYELIIDQLRDYRFYSADLVHPTELAVDFVWSVFQEIYFSKETTKISNQIIKFKRYFNHQILGVENAREKSIRLSKENELKTFLSENQQIIWQ